MFSKELQILDRNTVKYMIDEMQEELDAKIAEYKKKQEELGETKKELDAAKLRIAELEADNERLKKQAEKNNKKK